MNHVHGRCGRGSPARRRPRRRSAGHLVGHLADYTGVISDVGKPYGEGVADALAYVNQHGGINGKKIDFETVNYSYEIPRAIATYKKWSGGTKPASARSPSTTSRARRTCGKRFATSATCSGCTNITRTVGNLAAQRHPVDARRNGADGETLVARFVGALRDVTKLRGEVELVAPGALQNDGKVIEDARSYE